MPVPPVMVSAPAPPSKVLAPALPIKASSPPPPFNISLPEPPSKVSPAEPPVKVATTVLLVISTSTAAVAALASTVAIVVVPAIALVIVNVWSPVTVIDVASAAFNVVITFAAPVELKVNVSSLFKVNAVCVTATAVVAVLPISTVKLSAPVSDFLSRVVVLVLVNPIPRLVSAAEASLSVIAASADAITLVTSVVLNASISCVAAPTNVICSIPDTPTASATAAA